MAVLFLLLGSGSDLLLPPESPLVSTGAS